MGAHEKVCPLRRSRRGSCPPNRGTILSIKNKAEYLEVLLSSKDAADAL